MKSTALFVSLILLTALLSCKNKPQTTSGNNTGEDTAQATPYLPVAFILQSDSKLVDSFATGILKRINIDGKKDSAYIKPEEFHRLAAPFFAAEFDSASFRQHYKESSLMDASTEMLNFIYTAKDPAASLRQVVVYVSPTQTTDQTNRVYMEREFMQGDTLVKQKLTWKMKQYFYTLTVRQPATGTPITTVEKVIWDPRYFQED